MNEIQSLIGKELFVDEFLFVAMQADMNKGVISQQKVTNLL